MKTYNYGLKTLSYRATFIWGKLASEYRYST